MRMIMGLIGLVMMMDSTRIGTRMKRWRQVLGGGLLGFLILTSLGTAEEPLGRRLVSPAASEESKSWVPQRTIEFLLATQRESGAWAAGFHPNPDRGRGVTVGTTALACLALLEYFELDPARMKPAIDKGVKALKKYVWRKLRGANDFEAIAFGQLYTIQLLLKLARHPRWAGEQEALRQEIADVSTWLLRRQSTDGGWGYNASFHTGAALHVLRQVLHAGVRVHERSVEFGLEFLENLRFEQGYMYSANDQGFEDLPKEKALKDSCARLAACEWPLVYFGKRERKDLDRRIGQFMETREFLWQVRDDLAHRRRVYRRAGATPNAFFVFFGYYYTALALASSPSPQRQEWAQALQTDLVAHMEPDGTWYNIGGHNPKDPVPGSQVYATAMAVLALKWLERAQGETPVTVPPLPDLQALREQRWREEPALMVPRRLGIQATTDSSGGVRVKRVYDLTPARDAGLEPGDTLLMAGKVPLASVDDLIKFLGGVKPGETTVFGVRRGTRREEIAVKFIH